MAWEQLIAILKDMRDQAENDRTQPPVACPQDGEPLQSGPRGELHCPWDGYVWGG